MEDAPIYQKGEIVKVLSFSCRVCSMLGKGKGGYSYLAMLGNEKIVLKQIHHEPCSYYQFGNKIEAEKNDYIRLKEANIRIPKLIGIDEEKEIILKEYIEGETILDLIKREGDADIYLPQVREMAYLAKAKGLNIDYFPTNFVVKDEVLYYVDYECNEYKAEWDFGHWGIKYWSLSPELRKYLEENH